MRRLDLCDGIDSSLLQLIEVLCAFDPEEMWLLPEVPMRVGVALGEVLVQPSLPGSEEDLAQRVQVDDLDTRIGESMLGRLSRAPTAAAIDPIESNILQALPQFRCLLNA